ncbi:General amino acid permease AGP2 [Penicillium subrubescens]|uniref:General amino acid permease AGP2 n=1 Tax=Penicillium subrubescens TaxID=1316194 RepID=A0A1Q5T251_9EURO|nr:General amino acid permease AGP2 [Penicillium subrubescens]
MEPATHPPEMGERKNSREAMKGLDPRMHAKHDSEEALTSELISAGSEHLQRKLGGKEIQLLAVGGAIGTSLFVQMGASLPKGGPAGLFLGFVVYGTVIWCVNQCFAEMVTYLPIASPFIRLGGFWVDDAWGFAMGWNYFFLMAIFKVFLMLGLIAYTFVTMVGGNPEHWAYGFTYWKNPGAFVEYLAPGNTGRFLGFVSCIIQGSFTMVGPEFIAMTAGESENPRKLMHRAFTSFVWRLLLFFLGGALCVGIVIPYNDELLLKYIEGTEGGTGAASPYVISMVKFGIKGLPSLVNALIMTSVISCGNNVVYSSIRTLHGLAVDGKAPAIFAKCNKFGIPVYSVIAALAFCLLSLLQLGNTSATVLNWLVGICTASYMINYFATVVTYLHFYAALKRQGIDRKTLPYRGYFQPYAAYYAAVMTFVVALVLGYTVFIDGHWDITTFFTSYLMIGFFIVAFVVWKLFKRTNYVRPGTADLQLGDIKAQIDLYEALYEPPKRGKISGWFNSWFE